MNQKIVLRKRLAEFERRQNACKGNYTGTIINLRRRIEEIDNNQNQKKKSGNLELIIIMLFLIIGITLLATLIYKEVKTPVLTFDEAQTLYFYNGAKCLGFQTGAWDKTSKDARKVKIEYEGKTFWIYTDFDSAQTMWDKYQK